MQDEKAYEFVTTGKAKDRHSLRNGVNGSFGLSPVSMTF
jgi:hypothetical protein